MPTRVGPKTYGKDNLVFGYDTGDTVNSFIGKPTTNLATAIQSRGGDVTADPTDMPPLPRYIAPKVYCSSKVEESTTSWQSLFQYNTAISVADGERFIVTAWVFVPEEKTNNRFNINCSVNGANTGLTQNPSHDIPTGRWVKLLGSYTNNTGAAVSITSTRVETYTAAEWTGNITCWAANFMIEKGSDLPSAFRGSPATALGDTRSVSGSLLDLVGNTTIDVEDVSFDLNAQLLWDGTNDKVELSPNRQYSTSSAWSAELVFERPSGSAGSWNPLFGGGLKTGGYWMFHNSNVLSYYEGHWAPVTKIKYTSVTFDNEVNHHLVVTFQPQDIGSGSFRIYKNGEEAEDFDWGFSGSYSANFLHVGSADGRPGDHSVKVFNYYDRVLTPSEVVSNYKGVKGRFNIE